MEEIERFLAARTVSADDGAMVGFREMYEAYCEWVGGAAVAMPVTTFGNGMLHVKHRHVVRGGQRLWIGIRLRNANEQAAVVATPLPARSGPDPLADRYVLMMDLRAAGGELGHVAGRISGQRSVLAADIAQAEQAIGRATRALDHFKARQQEAAHA